MSGFLVDTNVLSEAVRTKPEPRVLDWIGAADETLLYLSVLTLGDIERTSHLRYKTDQGPALQRRGTLLVPQLWSWAR